MLHAAHASRTTGAESGAHAEPFRLVTGVARELDERLEDPEERETLFGDLDSIRG